MKLDELPVSKRMPFEFTDEHPWTWADLESFLEEAIEHGLHSEGFDEPHYVDPEWALQLLQYAKTRKGRGVKKRPKEMAVAYEIYKFLSLYV